MERKYVDVNVFVYWLAGYGEDHRKAKNWIEKIEKGKKWEYVTSILTIYETIVIIAGLTGRNLKDRKFIADIVTAFKELKNLKVAKLEISTIEDAIKAMDEYKLDFEDAIHYATAKKHQTKVIVTNDKHFQKTDIQTKF